MSVSSEYIAYASSVEPGLTLYGRFFPAAGAAPVLIHMHGWHGTVKTTHPDNVTPAHINRFCMAQPEMRGRGDSAGKPDANGWEMQDAVDMIEAVARLFPESVDAAVTPRLLGGSGGGGNVLGLVGKFPDLFASAVCECGISDYALWYAHDSVGEFRDELEGAGWVGGSPKTRPEAYLARGGRTTAMNLMTPLLIVHGCADPRVPVEQAQAYLDAARDHGRQPLVESMLFPGVGHPGHYGGLDAAGAARRDQAIGRHLHQFTQPPKLPERGTLVVAGFLRTRRFAVQLPSVDHVALLDYDLAKGSFALSAPTSREGQVALPGKPPFAVRCKPMALSALCERIKVPMPDRIV